MTIRAFSQLGTILSGMILLLAGGCVHFGNREGLPDSITSISIPVFRNKTLEPGAEEVVTSAVVRKFKLAGGVRLENTSAADAVLEGTIIRYRLQPISFDQNDQLTASNVEVTVAVTVRNAHNGEILVDNQAFTGSGIYFESTVPDERREDDVFIRLADDIYSHVVEGW